MSFLVGSGRIAGIVLIVPPSFPMVFLVRSYVRVAHMPQFGRGCDGGRIANRAPNELDCRMVE